MEAKNIKTIDEADRFVEGCLNDLIHGLSTKSETMIQMARYTGRMCELAAQKYLPLTERAFLAGRSKTSWKQFKKDNGL